MGVVVRVEKLAELIEGVLKPWKEYYATSGVDYVDFTDLDINTHKCYLLVFNFKNPSNNDAYYRLFVEGMYPPSYSYYSEGMRLNGTSYNFFRNVNSDFALAFAGNKVSGECLIFRDPDGYFRAVGNCVHLTAENVEYQSWAPCSAFTVSNITSIRVYSSYAGGIGAGSRIMLFRLGG
jgi:hypothetical protein